MSSTNKSRIISNRVIRIIKNEFKSVFDEDKYTLFSWGSLARREMGSYSDLDLIIIADEESLDYDLINIFKERISNLLPNDYLDVLESYSLKELERISNIDGTDMQALLFIRYESGKKRKITSKLNIVREILHIFCNLEYVYHDLYGKDNLKFGPYNIKYYNFALLLVKYFKHGNVDTVSALRYLGETNRIDKKNVDMYINNFNKILSYRDLVQISNETYNCTINKKNIIKLYGREVYSDIKRDLSNIYLESKKMYSDLKKVMFQIMYENISHKDFELLKQMIINKRISFDEINSIIEDNDEKLMMFLAYYLKDSDTLEIIRSKNEDKWYVLYGIANNKNSNADTLYKLIDYRKTSKKIKLKNIYEDFSWRNIYLYVAKNPSSNKKIKDYIINYKNARFMDIEAARKIKDE